MTQKKKTCNKLYQVTTFKVAKEDFEKFKAIVREVETDNNVSSVFRQMIRDYVESGGNIIIDKIKEERETIAFCPNLHREDYQKFKAMVEQKEGLRSIGYIIKVMILDYIEKNEYKKKLIIP